MRLAGGGLSYPLSPADAFIVAATQSSIIPVGYVQPQPYVKWSLVAWVIFLILLFGLFVYTFKKMRAR